MPTYACCCINFYSLERETTWMPINKRLGWRQSWMYSGGVLCCQKERWNLDICRKMRRTRKHCFKKDKWKSCALFHVWSPATISHENRCIGLCEVRGTSWRREGSEERVTEVHDTHICKGQHEACSFVQGICTKQTKEVWIQSIL